MTFAEYFVIFPEAEIVSKELLLRRGAAISKTNKGREVSWGDKISLANKGHATWNKGLTGIKTNDRGHSSWSKGLSIHTSEILRLSGEKRSVSLKKNGTNKGSNNPLFGTHQSSETKVKTLDTKIRHDTLLPRCRRIFSYRLKDTSLVYFRSSWELAYARYLDKNNIEYQYEPKRFKISNGTGCYTPDFYIKGLNQWHEVKGFLTDKAKEKMEIFKNEYPKETLCLIDEKVLHTLGVL